MLNDFIDFQIIGWVGSFLLAICGIPQAWQSYKQGHSDGISSGLLWLWGVGEILTLLYVFHLQNAALILNYACNLASISVILYFKFYPSRTSN